MDSWWDLGEWSGMRGNELATYDIPCAFCDARGNFAEHHHSERKNARGKTLNYDILKCENCGNLVMVFWSGGNGIHGRKLVPWPLKVERAPESWPAGVGNLWLQARRSLQSESWDAAAVMARSSLQAALRHVKAEGTSLFQEIESLGSRGLLPPTMVDWAHAVRLFGNDSAHPKVDQKPASKKEVTEAVRFIEFLFEYLFELPARIEKLRPKPQAPDQAQPPV
ncbi:DUF4145 domain-containing protein [Bosea vestrisii]|uniref:DUF4145 domain-containing protein n=1 Tax=Bosea vestrisii TaxID=151416 RepID=UPI0024E03492|nr:DUF4145 domain-containing protein [Bosea vestrisii]WID95723.1 DUF4145 domain-containing protein [Bosea vestrisii]